MTSLQSAMALRSAIKASPECCDEVKRWKSEALAIEPPEMDSSAIRMYLALKILREFHGNRYDAAVVMTIYEWIDGGMKVGLPWPPSAFFDEWAAKEGYSNIDGFVGLVFNAKIRKVG